jgi:hypothetical protein
MIYMVMLTKAITIVDNKANLFFEALKQNSFKVCTFTNPL